MKTTLLALALLALVAAPLAADRADDDLAAVRKAVHAESARVEPPARPALEHPPAEHAPAERPPAERPPAAEERQARRGEGPRWFHVRVVDKRARRGSVSINLPLGLVRAIGEDWPVQGCRRCEHGHGPTLGEILRSLDSGQSLVEIDDEGAAVRVWVD